MIYMYLLPLGLIIAIQYYQDASWIIDYCSRWPPAMDLSDCKCYNYLIFVFLLLLL